MAAIITDQIRILNAKNFSSREKPLCILMKTVMGKGVDFMENKAEWHHKVPSAEQYEAALLQLSKQ